MEAHGLALALDWLAAGGLAHRRTGRARLLTDFKPMAEILNRGLDVKDPGEEEEGPGSRCWLAPCRGKLGWARARGWQVELAHVGADHELSRSAGGNARADYLAMRASKFNGVAAAAAETRESG